MEDFKVKGKVSLTSIISVQNNSKEEEDAFLSSKFPQFLATFISTLGSFGLGCCLAYTSPALPDLEKSQYFGNLSFAATSWITSFAILGALISGPVSGFLINRLGRRKTMLLMSIPFTLGWLCIGLAKNVTMIHIGRFITGFTGGSYTVTIPVYVSEFVENGLRGMLGSAMVLMLVSGILAAYTIGAFVTWWQLALISGLAPLLCFIGLLFIPESPRFLLTRGKWNEAGESLRWFRGAKNLTQINPELSLIRVLIDSEKKKNSKSTWKVLLTPSVLKPLAVTLTLMLFQQTSGINAIQSYTVKIFQSASPQIDPNFATIIIGIVQVVFVFLSMMLVDRVGRKFLLILSFSIMAVSLLSLGAFFHVKESNEIGQGVAWIPLASLMFFVVAYSFGVGPLPWVLFSEIISPGAKDFGSAVVTSFYWIIAFVSTKTFEDLAAILGWQGYYWLLAGICISGGIFTIFMIPETKGKTQEEIQSFFNRNKKTGILDNVSEREHINPKEDIVDIDNNLDLKI